MKKKNMNDKLRLSKKTISKFQSVRLRGGGGGPEEPVREIGADATFGGCQCETEGGQPSCDGCLPTEECISGFGCTWPIDCL